MPVDDLNDVEEVDPRCIWPNEARDFTPWLAANINSLTKVLPFDLEMIQVETEVDAGYVDITATVAGNNTRVIIENQLEETDDDHLARILAYAATYDARIIIWIATDFAERHRLVLNRLNRNTTGDLAFYGVQLRTFRIGRSKPAPLFDLVIQPTATLSGIYRRNSNIAPEDDRHKDFFQAIVDELSKREVFDYETIRDTKSWFEFNSTLNGVTYVAAFTTRSTARVKLHIRCRIKPNHRIFEYLSKHGQEIEVKLGESLTWEERSRGIQHRHLIALYKPGSIDSPEEELSELSDWMIEKLAKLKQVFDPHLDDATT